MSTQLCFTASKGFATRPSRATPRRAMRTKAVKDRDLRPENVPGSFAVDHTCMCVPPRRKTHAEKLVELCGMSYAIFQYRDSSGLGSIYEHELKHIYCLCTRQPRTFTSLKQWQLCRDCDTCRWMQPDIFARVDGMSAVRNLEYLESTFSKLSSRTSLPLLMLYQEGNFSLAGCEAAHNGRGKAAGCTGTHQLSNVSLLTCFSQWSC